MILTDWISSIRKKYSYLNNFLITKHPFVWQTQVHLVVLYSLLFGLITFIMGLCYPVNFQELCSIGNEIAKTKYNSSAICMSFGMLFLIYWRRKIVQYKNADFSWRSSVVEAVIYFAGVVLIWGASNMFNLGINTRIGYFTLKGEKKYAELLHNTNFMVNGYIPHADAHKVEQSLAYFEHGDSLLGNLMARVFDLDEPEFTAKRYYNTQNQVMTLEHFYDNDSSYIVIDSSLAAQKPSLDKKKITNRYRTRYYIDNSLIEKQDNYIQIDTNLSNTVYSNLKYSFDEFVPKVNYDNYYSVNENIPLTRLCYGNYKALIDSSQYIISDIMYEDFVRNINTQKLLAGRKNFLEELTDQEKKDYRDLQLEIKKTFPYGDQMLIECSLIKPISKNMLKTEDDEAYASIKKREEKQSFSDLNENKSINSIKKIGKILDSLSFGEFRKDSLELSNKLNSFHQHLNPEAKRWYNLYNDEVYYYLKPLIKDKGSSRNNYYYNRRYWYATTDSLKHLYKFTPVDSLFSMSKSMYNMDDDYYYSNRSYNYYNRYNNTDFLGLSNNINYYIDSTFNSIIFNNEKAKTIQYIVNKSNYNTNQFAISGDFLYDYDRELFYYYRQKYNINDLRDNMSYLIKLMAFNELYSAMLEDYLASLKITQMSNVAYIRIDNKTPILDSIFIDNQQLIREMKEISPILRKTFLDNSTDTIKTLFNKYLTSKSTDYYSNAVKSILFKNDFLDTTDLNYSDLERTGEYYNLREKISNLNCISFPYTDYLGGEPTLAFLCYQKYKFQKYNQYFTPGNLDFFRINGFYVPETVTDNAMAFRYMSYYGLDMPKGIREVQKARKNIRHFLSSDIFQRHILSLLIFINAILFFTVSFETKVITSAFALAFLMLILLNFFLGKFLDANNVVTTGEFPSDKQKIVFLTILIPLAFSLVSLLLARRKITMPGFLMNMVVVFALSLLTTNPNLYYGDDLQTVDNPRQIQATAQKKDLTQYDLFYYLTLYLGLTVTVGSVLLRRNQVLPVKLT